MSAVTKQMGGADIEDMGISLGNEPEVDSWEEKETRIVKEKG